MAVSNKYIKINHLFITYHNLYSKSVNFLINVCTSRKLWLIINHHHNKHMVTIMNTATNTTTTDTTNNAVVAQDNENVATPAKAKATPAKAKAALTAQRKKASANTKADTTAKSPVKAKPTTAVKTARTKAESTEQKTDTVEKQTTRKPREVKGVTKHQRDLLNAITKEVHKAPRGSKLSTLHILTIKHSEDFNDISAKQFCTITKLPKAYGIEFIRLGSISNHLKECGLDITKL